MATVDITGVQMEGEAPTHQQSEAQKLATRASQGIDQGTVDLGIRGVQFNKHWLVKVEGKKVSQPFSDRTIAERFITSLDKHDQPLAEVVCVTSSGQEILLG